MSDVSKPDPDKGSNSDSAKNNLQPSQSVQLESLQPSAGETPFTAGLPLGPAPSSITVDPALAKGDATASNLGAVDSTHDSLSVKKDDSKVVEPVPVIPVPEPPKPATWTVNEPTEPWCPASLKDEIGFDMDYEHESGWSSSFGAGWIKTAATKRGRMHAHHGTFREDALWGVKSESFTFTVVCDGAGGSKLSRIGSEYTVRELSKLVQAELQAHEDEINNCSKESLPINLRVILHHCVDSVARKLVSLADKSGMEPKDFRCTLLTVLHYRHKTGGILLFGNVGDGFLALKRRGQPAERIGTSDSGAFSGEVTCFMPDPPVSDYYRKSIEENAPIPEEDVEAYILCTDGIEDPFFPVHRSVVAIFEQLFEGYKESIQDVTYQKGHEPTSVIRSNDSKMELLKWLNFEKRGENDDRTIALIYREELALSSKDELKEESQALSELKGKPIASVAETKSGFSSIAISPISLWFMIVGGLLVAISLLIGFLIGLEIGKSLRTSIIPNGYNLPNPG